MENETQTTSLRTCWAVDAQDEQQWRHTNSRHHHHCQQQQQHCVFESEPRQDAVSRRPASCVLYNGPIGSWSTVVGVSAVPYTQSGDAVVLVGALHGHSRNNLSKMWLFILPSTGTQWWVTSTWSLKILMQEHRKCLHCFDLGYKCACGILRSFFELLCLCLDSWLKWYQTKLSILWFVKRRLFIFLYNSGQSDTIALIYGKCTLANTNKTTHTPILTQYYTTLKWNSKVRCWLFTIIQLLTTYWEKNEKKLWALRNREINRLE